MSTKNPIQFDVTELNTISNPNPQFRDETQRMLCRKCRNWFLIGRGMFPEERIAAITEKHMELCEGDAAIALMKVEQWYGAQRPATG